jgi:hypothetical protein
MIVKHKNRCKLKVLDLQIHAAEQQLVRRKLSVTKNSSRLLYHLQQRITEPASLLLAGGVGFMFAELTQRQLLKTCNSINRNKRKETTILSIVQSCIALMHELYAALPLILIAKSYFEESNLNYPPKNRRATDVENVAPTPATRQID